MKLIRCIGAAVLVLALVLTLLPVVALAEEYSYQPIDGYTAVAGLTVESYADYPWTYDSSTGILTSGNYGVGGKAALSRLKVTVSQDGYLKFDHAMSTTGNQDYFVWRIGSDFADRNAVTNAGDKIQAKYDFTAGEIAVKAGEEVYFAYLKTKYSVADDYGQLRNLRLVTGGTVTLSSTNESLGTVSADRTNLTNLPAGTTLTVTATEAAGQFEGWYETIGDVTTRISGDNPFSYTVTETANLEARFIGVAADAVATIDGVGYDSLSAALSDAGSNATDLAPVTVKLMRDVEITENLTIPKNVILLVPYDVDDQGIDPNQSGDKDVVRQKGSVYRKLTVNPGVTVTVNGTLLVNASLASSDTGHQGSLGGNYGAMELNSPLVVNDGGALKVRGMLTGSGSVTAHSGGEVWQAFEMTDWPGGSMAAAMNGRGEFPISQYYFQRIQVPTTLEYGSSMSVFAYLHLPSDGSVFRLGLKNLIGTADTSFFKMNAGSSVTLGYVESTYTTTFEIHGSVEIRSFNISMANYSISTAHTICPIPASFAITVEDGATLAITENMKLMPGAVMTIREGAEVSIKEGKEFYLYSGNDYSEPRVIPSSSNATTPITPDGSSFIINYGTLNNNGTIHTSAGVENQIQHTEGGQLTGSGSISYGTVGKILLSYAPNGGQGSIESQYLEVGAPATLASGEGFTRAGFKFSGWSADPDFMRDPFRDTAEMITDMNISEVPDLGKVKLTLYAIWEKEAAVDPSEYAVWSVGGSTYTDFTAALSAASGGTNLVVLSQSGTLASGDYTIPAGVRVLIPYNSSYSYDVNPVGVDKTISAYVEPKNPYAVLTMANGAHITVNGELNVGSRMYSGASGSIYSGAPTGNSARIEMQTGSSITVNGTLYAYGFITGTGTVSAESGSHIHEMFQICEQRGGSAMMNMTSGTFPMTQYYVQNIEAPLTYKYGCTETLHTSMYILDQQNQCDNIAFLGSSSGLFRLGSGSMVTRKYDPTTDRITMDMYGNVTFASTSLVIQGQTVDTAMYTFPLTNNYTINIHSGMTTLAYPMEFLPGVRVTIDEGATLSVKSLYVYDSADWIGKGCTFGGADLIPVPYSPARVYNRTSKDLTDASIDVNGRIQLNASNSEIDGLFSTKSGAHIYTSKGTGTVYLGNRASTWMDHTTTRYGANSGQIIIPAAVVRLHNANAAGDVVSTDKVEYTETLGYPAGSQFHWCGTHQRWESETVTITYNANGGSGGASTAVHTPGFIPAQLANVSRENLLLKGWNTAADGSGTFYEDGGFMTLYESTTLYAQWQGKVSWVDGDGNVLSTEFVDEGDVPEYEGSTPSKTTDSQYSYTFAGWSTSPDGEPLSELPAVTGHVTYYAVFTGESQEYTVTWLNWDASTLSSGEFPYGVIPTNTGAEPSRPAITGQDYQIVYKFVGWNPEVVPVKGDATYVAKFEEMYLYYVRFYNADGSALLADPVLTAAGSVPKAPDATQSGGQTIVGWSTTPGGEPLETLPACTGSVNYYAVHERANSGLEGDINGDGTVSVIDLNKLLANFNKSGSNLEGDINGDGTVSVIDLNKLLANFNKSVS